MVWDFGAGDVVAGIRLALAVYQVSCVYENRAGERQTDSWKGRHELLTTCLRCAISKFC